MIEFMNEIVVEIGMLQNFSEKVLGFLTDLSAWTISSESILAIF